MNTYEDDTYGDAWVDFYDDPLLGWPSPEPAVKFLSERARGVSALDLGAGTGRVAIPLAETGIEVTAVDISDKMIDRLRAKIGQASVRAVKGDIRERCAEGSFQLIYCIGQSFLQLQSQDDQRQALLSMSEMLAPDGRIVLECLTPDLRRFRVGQDHLANKIVADTVVSTSSIHHPGEQRIQSMTVKTTRNGNEMYPNFIRYLWPSELLLLAELCGLKIVGRYSAWNARPYGGGPGAYIVELCKDLSE